ncbi:MAG: MCE family protein [Chlamydiia bacterium]|nr:MCE family protein [Chlamydiia bacterium]
MLQQSKNFMIGLFVIVALAVITYILLFLHPESGDRGQVLKVRFTDIDKINIGTRVLFAGFPVGEVTNIEEVEGARLHAVDAPDDDVYIYQLTLRIDSGVVVYTTDLVTPTTSGLLGEKQVLISPRPPKAGVELVRVTDQTLFAEPAASVENAIRSIGEVAEKINAGLATLEQEKFWENLAGTAQNIEEVTAAINQPEEISKFVENLNSGTIGKLFSSEDLYLRLTSVISKGETVMDDINHYGLLFNTSKEWQRLRARRMNLLAELSSPQEFTNYFNDEVNQIATSISRVGQVISDGCCPGVWSNVCSREFEDVFADLLRRIEGLESHIKLLNQQIVDERDRCCR